MCDTHKRNLVLKSSTDFILVGSARFSSHIPEDRSIKEMYEEDTENAKYEVTLHFVNRAGFYFPNYWGGGKKDEKWIYLYR